MVNRLLVCLDEKSYELKDHLGNVRVVISDVKIPADQVSGGVTFTAQPGESPVHTEAPLL